MAHYSKNRQKRKRRITNYYASCFDNYNQSSTQGFYFVTSILNLPNPRARHLTVAAFSPSGTLVGYRENWSPTISDIPAMGDGGDEYSQGYMNMGDIPTFKVYDSEIDIYYDASVVDGVNPWYPNMVDIGVTLFIGSEWKCVGDQQKSKLLYKKGV